MSFVSFVSPSPSSSSAPAFLSQKRAASPGESAPSKPMLASSMLSTVETTPPTRPSHERAGASANNADRVNAHPADTVRFGHKGCDDAHHAHSHPHPHTHDGDDAHDDTSSKPSHSTEKSPSQGVTGFFREFFQNLWDTSYFGSKKEPAALKTEASSQTFLQKLQSSFKALGEWFKELYTGFVADIKLLFQEPSHSDEIVPQTGQSPEDGPDAAKPKKPAPHHHHHQHGPGCKH